MITDDISSKSCYCSNSEAEDGDLRTGQLTGTSADGQLAHGLHLPGVLVLAGHLD